MHIYVVEIGDTIYSIASQYDVSVDSLIYNNQLEPPYRLAIGQAILIIDGTESQDRRSIVANGYAYPFISPWTLNQTLPYLSELSVFSYGFSTAGDLISPPLDDSFMIHSAKEFKTLPILTLTPFGPDGNFNNYLVSAISKDMDAQNNLINQLIETVQEKGFGGVNIDFEYILPEDRVPFADFVKNVTNAFNELGYEVSVALAPKTSDDQPGLLYEGKDYALLGAAANNVLLMTYEWGYTYGPPMAVAPINNVKAVLDYAVTKIPREKISMGIPNYGYDWTLPFEKGVSKAKTVGNIEAVQIAIDNNAVIEYDPVAQSPFFHYTLEGLEHEVWFEDVRSIQAKLNLVIEYEFRGVGYWQIMQLFRPNWILLSNMFWIHKQ